MPPIGLTTDIPFYAEPDCEGDWYPAAVKKKLFRREKKSKPEPLPRKEAELENLAAISELIDSYKTFGNLAAISDLIDSYKAIERSQYIEQLRDDWNDEGAQGYTRTTWRRTAWFAIVQVKAARDAGVSIGVPTIAPADQGSIDIHWEHTDRDLLINVPADPHSPATYYGASRSGETTSGLLDTQTARPDLLLWLSSGT